MKYLIRITESFLMILYIPMFRMFYYYFVLKTEYTASMIDLILVAPIFFINLYYFMLVLSQYEYSKTKYITYATLFLFFNLVINSIVSEGYIKNLSYKYLILFCVSLLIVFLNYKKKRIEPNNLIPKESIYNMKSIIDMVELLAVILLFVSLSGTSLVSSIFSYPPFISDVVSLIPSIITTLYYLLLILQKYKYSKKECITYISLFLITNIVFFTSMIYGNVGNIIYLYLGQFCIFLLVVFFHYNRRRIEPNNLIPKE